MDYQVVHKCNHIVLFRETGKFDRKGNHTYTEGNIRIDRNWSDTAIIQGMVADNRIWKRTRFSP